MSDASLTLAIRCGPVLVAAALAAAPALARDRLHVLTTPATCAVVRVDDGDTLRARCGGRAIQVRVAGIDAPERLQPFGPSARQRLVRLCLGEVADVSPTAIDRYGRTVADVKCAGSDVGEAMVRDGYAWRYAHFNGDAALARHEARARAARRGLWAGRDPVPPWEWRWKHQPQPATDRWRRSPMLSQTSPGQRVEDVCDGMGADATDSRLDAPRLASIAGARQAQIDCMIRALT